MHLITKTLLLATAILFMASCGGGEPAVASKLSKEAKAQLNKTTKKICPCLDKNGNDLAKVLDEIEPKIAEMEKEPSKAMEIMSSMKEKIKGIQEFSACFDKAIKGEDDKIVEEELEKAFPDLKKEAKREKELELIEAYIKKNCSNSAAFSKFVEFGKRMSSLRS